MKEANEIKVQVRILNTMLAFSTKTALNNSHLTSSTSHTLLQMGKYEQLTLDFQAKKADEEAQLEKIMEGLQEATAELRASLEVAQVSSSLNEGALTLLCVTKMLETSWLTPFPKLTLSQTFFI